MKVCQRDDVVYGRSSVGGDRCVDVELSAGVTYPAPRRPWKVISEYWRGDLVWSTSSCMDPFHSYLKPTNMYETKIMID
jgi:hypothetical protein